MENLKEKKKAFRRMVREEIAKISAEEKMQRADFIFEQIAQMPEFQRAENVLMFWSLPDEIYTHQAVVDFARHKTVILPITIGNDLIFSRFTTLSDMNIGQFGIAEPKMDDIIEPSLIDFAIIPGVAFDKANNRMGRGRGFYDRILASISATKVGICLREQFFEEIPTENFDKKMDKIIFS